MSGRWGFFPGARRGPYGAALPDYMVKRKMVPYPTASNQNLNEHLAREARAGFILLRYTQKPGTAAYIWWAYQINWHLAGETLAGHLVSA